MKGTVAALAALCLLTAGCTALPGAMEPENMAIISVLGVDWDAGIFTVYSAVEGRSGEEPEVFSGHADSLAGAIEATRDMGKQTLSYAHVEHILLGESAASQLSHILSYGFRTSEQSTETNLWLLRDVSAGEVFSKTDHLPERMTTLKYMGEKEKEFALRSLRSLAEGLADGDGGILPALTQKDNSLVFDGYGLFRGETLAGFTGEELARGTALLSGGNLSWTVATEEGAVVVKTRSSSVRPVWNGDVLTGLSLRYRLQAAGTEDWDESSLQALCSRLEGQTGTEIQDAAAYFRKINADCGGLYRRAGLRDPLRWDKLKETRKQGCDGLTLNVKVSVEWRGGGSTG